jgi:hypothetical protein
MAMTGSMLLIAWIGLTMRWAGMEGSMPSCTVAATTLPMVFVGALEGICTLNCSPLKMAHVPDELRAYCTNEPATVVVAA